MTMGSKGIVLCTQKITYFYNKSASPKKHMLISKRCNHLEPQLIRREINILIFRREEKISHSLRKFFVLPDYDKCTTTKPMEIFNMECLELIIQ